MSTAKVLLPEPLGPVTAHSTPSGKRASIRAQVVRACASNGQPARRLAHSRRTGALAPSARPVAVSAVVNALGGASLTT
ncbi:MAG: hypothetical protein WDO74_31330 [Pseudomonadota bacterium]